MILILAFAAGAWLGWRRAERRGGQLADKLQWGFAHGVIGAILALVAALTLGFSGLSPFPG